MDHQVFLPDPRPGMTTQEKNDYLSAELAVTYNDKNIVLIERLEIAVKGWRITYR